MHSYPMRVGGRAATTSRSKGDQARLLSVAERTRHLFGNDQAQRAPVRLEKK
jgi:hypothetical protein